MTLLGGAYSYKTEVRFNFIFFAEVKRTNPKKAGPAIGLKIITCILTFATRKGFLASSER